MKRESKQIGLGRITAKWLLAAGACTEQVQRFIKIWPRGITPSQAAWKKAQLAGLDWEWIGSLLPQDVQATYEAARASALAAYEAATASALIHVWRVAKPPK